MNVRTSEKDRHKNNNGTPDDKEEKFTVTYTDGVDNEEIFKDQSYVDLLSGTKPFTMERALHWLQRQVAPTLKMVQELDKMNHTTIMDDMLEHTELKDKHRHLLELEKTTIEERIDTAVSKETDGIF